MAKNIKLEKISSLIKQNVSFIVRHKLRDPSLNGVTVTEVKVTPDLSLSTIYIVLSKQTETKEILKNLNEASGFVRHKLAESMKNLRKIPKIRFAYDEKFEWGFELSNLLKDHFSNFGNI